MKGGLGKGLDKLMDGDKIAAGQPLPDQSSTAKPLTGRGVTRLVQGSASVTNPQSTGSTIDAPVREPRIPAERGNGGAAKPLIPAWFFYGSDLLLLLLSVAVAFSSPKPLDARTVLFCAVAIALGGMLSIIGLLRSHRS